MTMKKSPSDFQGDIFKAFLPLTSHIESFSKFLYISFALFYFLFLLPVPILLKILRTSDVKLVYHFFSHDHLQSVWLIFLTFVCLPILYLL